MELCIATKNAMSKHHSFYDTVDQIITYGIEKGILHLYTGNDPINGTTIMLNGQPVINFGSCSYLGLEFDPRLKAAASLAIEKFGTQFSESRAYVSLGLYKELESLLQQIFDASCVITPTTTLGHVANIPVLVEDEDAVIMDQQVHNSVQTAVQLVKARGVPIELIRHNRMDLLEERIKALRQKHKRIWYMADGIYSMFGDTVPVDQIYLLLNRYPEFYFYVDDAHGMSVHGKHGRGFVLRNHDIHPRMCLVTSLNKAFASGGGVMVYGNKELARKVGTVGGPLLSSGPMQPSGVGAAIASAHIHLTHDIVVMQDQLRDNILFTNMMLTKYKLPVISEAGAAIFFVGVSLPSLGHNVVKRMLNAGYYVNLGVFPTVPMKQTGIRFTVTRLHTFKEIEAMVSTLSEQLLLAMKQEGISLPQIYKAFKKQLPEHFEIDTAVSSVINQSLELRIFHSETILHVEKNEWNRIFENKGSFDWNGLKLLESAFTNNELPQDNWKFHYIIIKDLKDNVVAATFCTVALWKDDMLSPKEVSMQVEDRRKSDPYYLTSKVLSAGTLITEGEHLYIDYSSSLWRDAMHLLLEKMYSLQEMHKANRIVIRDFSVSNSELDNFMVDNGYFKIKMPDAHSLSILSWNNDKEWYRSLSTNNRNHLRKKILKNESQFAVDIITVTDWQEEIDYWYELYLKVQRKSVELNTFPLPKIFFNHIARQENWEVLQLSLKGNDQPCCVVFSYKSKTNYLPTIIGIDYMYNSQYGIYRQALYQLILRAKQLGSECIKLGFSATIEKQKFGIKPQATYAYMHLKDSYNLETLSLFDTTIKNNA